jgi:hypothetical protein
MGIEEMFMDLGSILLGLALALIVGVILVRPLLAHSGEGVSESERRLSMYQAERDRILNRLQELEMDFTMGKVIEGDYARERQELMREGAEVLRQMDALGGDEMPTGESLDARVEAAISGARAKTQRRDGFCPNCGAEVQAGDLFCTRCGQAIQEAEVGA